MRIHLRVGFEPGGSQRPVRITTQNNLSVAVAQVGRAYMCSLQIIIHENGQCSLTTYKNIVSQVRILPATLI